MASSMVHTQGYEKILGKIESSKAYQQSTTASEIAKNLADVKTMLLRKVSTLEDLTKPNSNTNLLRGGDFTIHVESKPYKGERIPTYSMKARPSSRQRKRTGSVAATSFTGAPFNVRSQRFASEGLHPRHFQLAGVTPPSHKTSDMSSDVYRNIRTTDEREADRQAEQASKTGWKRHKVVRDFVMKTEQIEMKKAQQEIENRRGPGFYHKPDRDTESNRVVKGVSMMSRAGRKIGDPPLSSLEWGHLHHAVLRKSIVNPGPGTYRINHDPYRVVRQGVCMFDSSPGHRDLPVDGTNLPPGLYVKKGFAEEMCKRMVSDRGPYHLFSGSRYAKLNTGTSRILNQTSHSQDKPWMSPGMYSPKWEVPCFKKFEKRLQNVFREEQQIRKHNSYPPLYPVNTNPGPGSYEVDIIKSERRGLHRRDKVPTTSSAFAAARSALWKDKLGFLSSTKRRDKVTHIKWGYGPTAIGPARYRVRERDDANGHTSVFKSKSARSPVYKPVLSEDQEVKRKTDAFNRINHRMDEIRHGLRKHFSKEATEIQDSTLSQSMMTT